jgi:hypothetical protein
MRPPCVLVVISETKKTPDPDTEPGNMRVNGLYKIG